MVDKQKDLVYKVLIHLHDKLKLNKKSEVVFKEYMDFYKQEEPVNENDPEIMYENYKSW